MSLTYEGLNYRMHEIEFRNPIKDFDFDTPRTIHIRPYDQGYNSAVEGHIHDPLAGRGGIKPFTRYVDLEGRVVIMYDYELDREFNAVVDEFGNKRIKKDPEGNPVLLEVSAEKFKSFQIRLPQEKERLKTLMQCPRCANVLYIHGRLAKASYKTFWIDDPELEKNYKQKERQSGKEAEAFFKSIPTHQLPYYCSFLHLEVDQVDDTQEPTEEDYRYALDDYRREMPVEFLERTKNNELFKEEMLFHLAEEQSLLVNRGVNDGGYFYIGKGKKEVPLGISMEHAINNLNLSKYSHIRMELYKRTGFGEAFLTNFSEIEQTVPELKAVQQEDSEIDELRLQVMQLKEMLNQALNQNTGVQSVVEPEKKSAGVGRPKTKTT